MSNIMKYTGPDIKFGAKVIPSGVVFYYDEASGDLLLAGSDKPMLALPQVVTSLMRNSEPVEVDGLTLWPKSYAKIAAKAAKSKPIAVEEDTKVEVKPWHPRSHTLSDDERKIAFEELVFAPSRPVSKGSKLKLVDMSGVPKRDNGIVVEHFDAKVLRPIVAKYNINLSGIGPMSDEDALLLQEEVLPRLGLRKGLPDRRVYLAQSHTESTCIYHLQGSGNGYGLVIINPDQLNRILGGYNTYALGQALTHELAHYIDTSVVRNTARVEFDRAMRVSRGKLLHPDQGADPYKFSKEQFAMLAEAMVWGHTVRGLYSLNGIDVVGRYFYNNWIPEDAIEDENNYVR